MKHFLFILFAVAAAVALHAQESVTINAPASQCYQDLKATLPEAIRWNDQQMTVTSRPLLTTMSGNVEVVAQIFPKHGLDKETHEKVEVCKLVVGISARTHTTAWNAWHSSWLHRNASLMKARIESAMKARRDTTH